MKYCIDTSALIGAWHEVFPRDLFEPLWEVLEDMCNRHGIISVENVMDELREREGDKLVEWAEQFDSLSYPLDDELQPIVTRVMDTCSSDPRTGLVNPKKLKSDGDPFVIALALKHGITVVSQEQQQIGPNDRIKIPQACTRMGVRHMSLFEMARAERWKFDLVAD